MPKSKFAGIGQVFLHHVGNTERNQFWLTQVEKLPEIMDRYLNQKMSYFLLIQMRIKVLKHLLDSGFAKKLQDQYNNGCFDTISKTYKSLRNSIGKLKGEIRRHCKKHNMTELDMLSGLITSPEAQKILSSGKLTVADLLICQPELFFAIDFTPKKK